MVVVDSSRLPEACELQNFFFLRAPKSYGTPGNHKIFRNPFGLFLLRNLATRLQTDGFQVTQVKTGRACDAWFNINFEGFHVSVVVLVKQQADFVECNMMTWLYKPWWKIKLPASALKDWARTCEAIERLSRDDPRLAVERLTETQARSRGF